MRPVMTVNDAYISVLAMPIGLFTCFAPAIIVWVLTEMKNPPED